MKIIVLPFLLLVNILFAQTDKPTSKMDGSYHLLESERGLNNQPTKTKLVQLVENNGVQMLAIAACEKCIPAIYTYKAEDSETLDRHTYFNSMGIFVTQYDNESFVAFMPNPNSTSEADYLLFSNFYSKSKSKVESMTKAKIKNYVLNL